MTKDDTQRHEQAGARAASSDRVHVWIQGRVQGVFFRESTRREAERLGVKGWVRNLPDGRVEGAFEGTPDAVGRLVEWCRRGPAGAQVEDLEARPEPVQGEAGFRILR